jgi:hypothetical protein
MIRIITPADLQGRSLSELQALFHAAQQELVQSEAGSQARRDALSSLDALSLAIAQRRLRGPGL